jgi:drug/metabolite transporter (DMT)-like permease
MFPLAIAVLSTSAFSLIMRHTQRRDLDQMAVMMVNYVVASVVGFAIAYQFGGWHASPPTLRIGLIAGAIYVTTYVAIMRSMELRGVAIANAVTRLSVLIPMLLAVVIWHESPSRIQGLGAGLAVLAMPFLTLDRTGPRTPLRKRQVLLLLGLFLTNGAVLITSKWFHSAGPAAEVYLYFGIVYGVSAVIGTGLWLAWSRRCGMAELRWGAALGLVNIITGVMLLAALDALPGAVVFPVFAALGLALTTGFAAWAWREVPGKLGQAGIAIAVVAAVLINL